MSSAKERGPSHDMITWESLVDSLFKILFSDFLHKTNFPTPGRVSEDFVDFLMQNHSGSWRLRNLIFYRWCGALSILDRCR